MGNRDETPLSQPLFIAVLDLISRKTVMKDAMKKLLSPPCRARSSAKSLYADDLVLVANGKEELHDTLKEWNGCSPDTD